MTETTSLRSTEPKGQLRAALWEQSLASHVLGEVRVTEVRGSDYVGPGAGPGAHAGDRMLKPLVAGRTVRPIGAIDQPHSWTYLPDFARALVAAGASEDAWGKPWIVPAAEPLSVRELVRVFADGAGVSSPRIAPVPVPVLRTLGVVSPMMRELAREGYQFTEPFVVDATLTQTVLGIDPTPWSEVVPTTLAALR